MAIDAIFLFISATWRTLVRLYISLMGSRVIVPHAAQLACRSEVAGWWLQFLEDQ
jgi:hypothetical protein